MGPDGELAKECTQQENYVEDRFDISTTLQSALAHVVTAGGEKRVKVPEALARELVTHADYAYWGPLEVVGMLET